MIGQTQASSVVAQGQRGGSRVDSQQEPLQTFKAVPTTQQVHARSALTAAPGHQHQLPSCPAPQCRHGATGADQAPTLQGTAYKDKARSTFLTDSKIQRLTCALPGPKCPLGPVLAQREALRAKWPRNWRSAERPWGVMGRMVAPSWEQCELPGFHLTSVSSQSYFNGPEPLSTRQVTTC